MNTLWKHRFSNYSCGALTIAAGLGVTAAGAPLWNALQRATPLHWPGNPLFGAALAFVAIDLLYYALHRAEHSTRALWAIHSVHHQSTICDASVSLRTSMLTPVTVFASQLVLAALGLSLPMYLVVYALHVAMVFLLHTRTPAFLNRAGLVMNRPWLHRGHHSNHPALRGKNLGGVLIVWDRLFGTFEPNCEQATEFGIGKASTPLSPWKANVEPLRVAFRAAVRAR